MGELRKSSTSRSSSKKKKDVKTVGTGITKDRATKSKSSKRLSERFHGMEDSTPRVSHLRKTISESKVSKAKSIPSLASDDSNGNNGSKRTFVDAASAVTFQLSSAFNKLADITSEFLYPPDEKPGLVDISTDTMPSTPQSIRLQLETTFSTITTDLEGGKLESSFNKEIDNSIVDKESLITPPRKAERQRHKGFSEEKKMESPQQSFHDLSTPDRSSFDSHSNLPPPPQLLEGRVHAKHSASQQLHRPVPVPGGSPIGTAFETPKRVYPKREDEYAYMRTTPIARMRHLEAQKAASIQDVTPNHSKSEEELKKEKQRKWRRRIKMAETKREKERRELYDDTTTAVGTSATNAAGPCKDGLGAAFMESTTSPILLFQQLIRTRCGVLEDSLSFDSGDDESQSGVSQDSEEFVTTEDEEESVDGTTDRNRSLETSMFTDSLASESRSLFNTPEQRTGPLPATPSTMNEQPLLNISDDSGNPLSKQETNTSRVELNDKNFIKTFILESSKDGVPLLWHKEEPKANSFSRPSPIMCFLAFGSKGPSGTFEGPRLLLVMSDGTHGDSIDLFDIRSLEKASPLQLQAYPFAIPGRSIVVRCTSDKEMVFEAPNEAEALRFIHGMRWVVARLAFNLIIGNLDVCCELLNVAKGTEERKYPSSLQEEALWAKAMNEVTHKLVEKSVFQTAE